MKKYCGNCGADLPIDAKFCGNCGTVLGQEPITKPGELNETEPLPDQSNKYSTTGSPSRKSYTKIMAVAGIIVVAVVLGIVFIVFFTGGASGQFVGAWNIVSGGSSDSSYTTYIFEANGDLRVGSAGTYTRVGTWRTDGGILYLESIAGTSSPSGATGISARYIFSDGGRTLTLYPLTDSGTPAVFTKR